MKSILPLKTDDAVRKLIEIVKALHTITENEGRHILVKNEVGMAMTNDDKDILMQSYTKAIQEYKVRRNEFKNADPALIDQLMTAQNALSAVATENQALLDSLKITE